MKKARTLVTIGLVSVIGLVVSCWCMAQTNAPAKKPITGDSNPALDRLTALVSYLETNKQTNALSLFYEYANASQAQQHSADIGVTLHILMALREGRTTNAMELLEGSLDSASLDLPRATRSFQAHSGSGWDCSRSRRLVGIAISFLTNIATQVLTKA